MQKVDQKSFELVLTIAWYVMFASDFFTLIQIKLNISFCSIGLAYQNQNLLICLKLKSSCLLRLFFLLKNFIQMTKFKCHFLIICAYFGYFLS